MSLDGDALQFAGMQLTGLGSGFQGGTSMRGAEEMAPYSQFYQRVPQNNLRCASLYCAGLSLLEQLPVPPLPPLPRFRCSLIPVPRCGSDLATFSAIWPTLASLKACWWMTSASMTSGLWFQDGRCFDAPCSVLSGGRASRFCSTRSRTAMLDCAHWHLSFLMSCR